MEVKIGVRNATRELVIESSQTPDEVYKTILKALGAEQKFIELSDERGRRVIVLAEHLTYVEIGESADRRVGFGL